MRQEAPSGAREGEHEPTIRTCFAPRCPQEASRGPREAPGGPQEAPKRTQRGLTIATKRGGARLLREYPFAYSG